MAEKEGIGTSLVATLKSDDAVSIAANASELAIDAVLEDGILKDIPVFGTLVSLAKVGFSIRDRIFISKLVKFLSGLDELSADERKSMAEKLDADPAYGRNTGEHLIEILERIDAHRKPFMIAKVFSAYVKGTIDANMLNRLNLAIDQIPFYEIDNVRKVRDQYLKLKEDNPEAGLHSENLPSLQALERTGLLSAVSGWGALVYLPTDLCGVFLSLALDSTKK